MIKVIGVRFKDGGKIYFFDPADIEINKGDYVIVDTARGLECGLVVQGIHTESEDKIVKPLKAVSRIATESDIEKMNQNRRDEKKAYCVLVFNNTDVAPYMTAEYYFIRRNSANYSMSLHTHYFYVRDGYIYMSSNGGESDSVDWTGGEQGFNIADTQYYKDAVDAAESAGAAGVEVNSIVITSITERTTAYYVTVEIGLSNGVTTTQTRLYNK